METQTKQLITRETTIGEIVQKYPAVVPTLTSYGVHCVGCHVSPYESLEMGFQGHGMGDEEIDEAVVALNDVIQKNGVSHTDEEYDISMTDTAAERIQTLLADKKHQALRISVHPGGCSGFEYVFTLDAQAPQENDLVVVQDGATLYADMPTIEKINKSVIDYKDSLQDAGFMVSNPNAHSTCGCGDSFS